MKQINIAQNKWSNKVENGIKSIIKTYSKSIVLVKHTYLAYFHSKITIITHTWFFSSSYVQSEIVNEGRFVYTRAGSVFLLEPVFSCQIVVFSQWAGFGQHSPNRNCGTQSNLDKEALGHKKQIFNNWVTQLVRSASLDTRFRDWIIIQTINKSR